MVPEVNPLVVLRGMNLSPRRNLWFCDTIVGEPPMSIILPVVHILVLAMVVMVASTLNVAGVPVLIRSLNGAWSSS